MNKTLLPWALLLLLAMAAAAQAGVIPTSDWHNFYGCIAGAETGDVITAKDPDGVVCGEYTIKAADLNSTYCSGYTKYGFMPVYEDDNYTIEDEGAEPGDTITFYYNGGQVPENATWLGGKQQTRVDLTISWILHLREMPSYQKEQTYYSGAASAQMILNYIRGGAGYPNLTQNEIYDYGHPYNNLSGNSGLLEMDAKAMDAALGHFDPYDSIVNNSFDVYDSRYDGNPYQGYNFGIDAYNPATNPNAMNNYMRDIAHWMALNVTREGWWLQGDLVARPNTPAAVPIYGSYNRWIAVNGYAVSENPIPYPYTNPWYTPNITVYGFWLTDPTVGGIGQHVYVTAAEAQATYFLPLNTSDIYNGTYLQVAEPPAVMSDAVVVIPGPVPNMENLEFLAADMGSGYGSQASKASKLYDADMGESLIVPMASVTQHKTLPKFAAEMSKEGWEDLVDPHILSDPDAVAAFEGAKMKPPILVRRLDGGDDYYLIRFNKEKLTSGVIMLDSDEGYFRQASWTSEPFEYAIMRKGEAIILVLKYETGSKRLDVKTLKKLKSWNANAELVWMPGLSPSPFYPVWKVSIGGKAWFVTQDGKVTGA